MFDAVIFDLDGTLIDTEAVAFRVGLEAFRTLGLPADAALFHRMIGKDAASSDLILRETYPELDLVEFDRLWRGGFEAALRIELPIKAGAHDLLDQIALPKVLCTSSRREAAHEKLGLAQMAHHFAAVVTRDDIENPKPHPEPYLYAARLLNVAPDRCLVFEDSETGAASARAAGCVVVQVPDVLPTDGEHAHHVAPTLIEGARMAGLIR